MEDFSKTNQHDILGFKHNVHMQQYLAFHVYASLFVGWSCNALIQSVLHEDTRLHEDLKCAILCHAESYSARGKLYFWNIFYKVTDQEEKDQGERVCIEAGPVYDYTVRFCTYHNITDKHMESVKAKLRYVLAEYADVPYTRSEVLQHKKTVQLRQKQDWFAAAMPRGASCESLLYDLGRPLFC